VGIDYIRGEYQEMNKPKKCNYCKDKGMIQIAPNVRGIKKCPFCNGKGYLS
jgi:DnaJ-class molecular chaperone